MTLIYAEWKKNGAFNNGLFHSWDEYHATFFDPEIELLCMRILK